MCRQPYKVCCEGGPRHISPGPGRCQGGPRIGYLPMLPHLVIPRRISLSGQSMPSADGVGQERRTQALFHQPSTNPGIWQVWSVGTAFVVQQPRCFSGNWYFLDPLNCDLNVSWLFVRGAGRVEMPANQNISSSGPMSLPVRYLVSSQSLSRHLAGPEALT